MPSSILQPSREPREPRKLRFSKIHLEAQLCKESFYDFAQRFWETISPEKLVLNWHIEVICNEVQQVIERAIRREKKLYDLIINVSPGSTKSTLCSEMLPAWVWAVDPTFRCICGSYAYPLAMNLANYTRKIVTSDKYRELFPDVHLEQDSKGLLVTTKGGQRMATSTGGSITGMHGHAILIDDPINPKKAVSDVALKLANDWFDHTLMSRMVDKSVTPLILIMQRLAENDPTGHQKTKSTPTRHICLPATVSNLVRPRSLRRLYKNGLFDPIRLPLAVLDQTRIEMGEYAYAGQYDQSPVPMGGGMFKADKLQVMSHKPGKLIKTIRFWDKAATGGKGAWTVGILMGMDPEKNFWILDVVRGQWESAQRERTIRQTAELDGKAVLIGIEQEPGSGGKESAQGTVKNLAGFRVKVDRPVGDKKLRADPFATQVNGGNVKIVKGDWNSIYLHEMRYFPFSKWKDQVDASSGAFAMLVQSKMRLGAF